MLKKGLEIQWVDIDFLKKYDKNTKSHPKSQIKTIKSSIKKYGFNVPILIDKENTIIAGHGRVIAAGELDYKEVPTIKITDLTPPEIKAFRIMDNKSTESEWELDLLKEEFEELLKLDFDMNFTGFNENEIARLVNIGNEAVDDGFVEVSAYERAKNKTKIQIGEIYGLGTYIIKNGKEIEVEIIE